MVKALRVMICGYMIPIKDKNADWEDWPIGDYAIETQESKLAKQLTDDIEALFKKYKELGCQVGRSHV